MPSRRAGRFGKNQVRGCFPEAPHASWQITVSLAGTFTHRPYVWRKVTIPVTLTDEQETLLEPELRSVSPYARATTIHGARRVLTGVELPRLGFVRHRRPTLIVTPTRRVRVLAFASGSRAIEYTVRSLHSFITPFRLIALAMLVIAVAVGVAALTTRDRGWWTEAFSRLGVFDDLSSLAFNTGLITTGIVGVLSRPDCAWTWHDLAAAAAAGELPPSSPPCSASPGPASSR